jgi:hypothetical protein
MRLPTQLLQRIIGHPVAHFSGSGHQRALGRVEVQTSATISPVHEDVFDDPFPVTLSDISTETVGLISPRAMMPNSNIILSIPVSAGDDPMPVTIRCRIMRCLGLRDGRFTVVAEFLSICPIQSMRNRA